MSNVALPNEVLDLILEQIDSTSIDGRRDLSACSLVNQALRGMAQERIFRHVEISYAFISGYGETIMLADTSNTTGPKFLHIIAASPFIASYVQGVSIKLIFFDEHTYANGTVISSNKNAFSLNAIIPLLNKLRKFSFQHSYNFVWPMVDKQTQSLFCYIATVVQELDLQAFGQFPLSAFFDCPNLRSLRIRTLEGIATPEDKPPAEFTKIELGRLEVTEGAISLEPFIFIAPSSPFNLACLQTLVIFGVELEDEHVAIDDVLAQCSSSLMNLTLDLKVTSREEALPPSEDVLNLSSLQNLQSLTIKATMLEPSGWGHVVLNRQKLIRGIGDILKTLSPTRQSPGLQIEVNCKMTYITIDEISSLPWTAITDVLHDLQVSHCVRKVELILGHFLIDNDYTLKNLNDLNLPASRRILDSNQGLKASRENNILTSI